MKKYYIGVTILIAITLGLTGYIFVGATAEKQDRQTEKKAQEIVTKLNSHIRTSQKIPENLTEAGIKDVPSTISYSKQSSSEYEFCTTYKSSKGYGYSDPSSILSGMATRQLGGYDTESSNSVYKSSGLSSLYVNYTHKKGKNCQTVKPYLYNYDSTDNLYYNKPNNSSSSSLSSSSQDVERKTDIMALQSQLEDYYNQNGVYPTVNDINSASWRSINMKNLNKEYLRDPLSGSYALTSIPMKNYYSYEVLGSNGKACMSTDCASYTLSAKLSDGTSYVKQSLI
ncbi:hypothetical protein HY003_03890 [Candidatus Saccharibacteria bacterium]|nr:hypothetical protein [Candidatus Saccharibacteria bacterium]MBI3338414.1 hypothetical protein [Candidatus Saccharibacteria bacterium]